MELADLAMVQAVLHLAAIWLEACSMETVQVPGQEVVDWTLALAAPMTVGFRLASVQVLDVQTDLGTKMDQAPV
jgi:hypothetical protein